MDFARLLAFVLDKLGGVGAFFGGPAGFLALYQTDGTIYVETNSGAPLAIGQGTPVNIAGSSFFGLVGTVDPIIGTIGGALVGMMVVVLYKQFEQA